MPTKTEIHAHEGNNTQENDTLIKNVVSMIYGFDDIEDIPIIDRLDMDRFHGDYKLLGMMKLSLTLQKKNMKWMILLKKMLSHQCISSNCTWHVHQM